MNTFTPKYYLGIDGGATKTTFALSDSQGNILRTLRTNASNPFDLGFERATELLRSGINEIVGKLPYSQISMFAGLSGGISGNMRERFADFFANFGFLRFDNGSDIQNIASAGLKGNDGIALIMGTGSSGIIQKNGVLTRIGGFGYLFDQGGSGYDVAAQAIRAALMAEDGTGAQTALLDAFLKKTNTQNLLSYLPEFYLAGKRGIAAFCPLVFEVYKQTGDAVAEDILRKNMSHVALLLSTARKKLGQSNEKTNAVFVGGLTGEKDLLFPFLLDALDSFDGREHYTLSVYAEDVVNGALYLAGMPRPKND